MTASLVPLLEHSVRPPFVPVDLTEETAEHVERAAHRIRALGTVLQAQAERATVEIGRVLINVKPILGHGQFGKWLEAEFGWTDRTARNLMAAARLADAKSEIVSALPPTGLYKLASDTTPETCVNDVIGRLEAGERFSSKEIGRIVTDARKREDQRKTADRKLARRLNGKTDEQRQRVQRAEEARQREQEREEQRIRRRQEARDRATADAIALLQERLGGDLHRFAGLVAEGGWDFLDALRKATSDEGGAV